MSGGLQQLLGWACNDNYCFASVVSVSSRSGDGRMSKVGLWYSPSLVTLAAQIKSAGFAFTIADFVFSEGCGLIESMAESVSPSGSSGRIFDKRLSAVVASVEEVT